MKKIILFILLIVLITGCSKKPISNNIAEDDRNYGYEVYSPERIDSIHSQISMVYDKIEEGATDEAFLSELDRLADTLEHAIMHDADIYSRVFFRFVTYDLSYTLAHTYHPVKNKDVFDRFERVIRSSYLWSTEYHNEDSLHMEMEMFPMDYERFENTLFKTVLLAIHYNKSKNWPLVLSVDLPSIQDASSFRIDFYDAEKKINEENGTMKLLHTISINDAVKIAPKPYAMYYFPLEKILDCMSHATTMVISYDDVSLMHSLLYFKEIYYDDLKAYCDSHK